MHQGSALYSYSPMYGALRFSGAEAGGCKVMIFRNFIGEVAGTLNACPLMRCNLTRSIRKESVGFCLSFKWRIRRKEKQIRGI